MANLIDSGDRREFNSGAVRDIAEGKGRCDLMPLSAISYVIQSGHTDMDLQIISSILKELDSFIYTGSLSCIQNALKSFISGAYGNKHYADAFLDVSIHYEDGCRKYGERNWEKGIPLHCYVDSGVRHLLKSWRGDDDEPHNRAFIWNMLGIIWTVQKFIPANPEQSDYILDLPGFKE